MAATTGDARADAMIADEETWHFSTDPTNAIAHATRAAAQYAMGTSGAANTQYSRAPGPSGSDLSHDWTKTAVALTKAAGRKPGTVLQDLKNRWGL